MFQGLDDLTEWVRGLKSECIRHVKKFCIIESAVSLNVWPLCCLPIEFFPNWSICYSHAEKPQWAHTAETWGGRRKPTNSNLGLKPWTLLFSLRIRGSEMWVAWRQLKFFTPQEQYIRESKGFYHTFTFQDPSRRGFGHHNGALLPAPFPSL